jgi:hypothetical protein
MVIDLRSPKSERTLKSAHRVSHEDAHDFGAFKQITSSIDKLRNRQDSTLLNQLGIERLFG